jgi:hypothetical protein
MIQTRDVELGALLDELEVGEHGEEYWESVLVEAEPELERLRGQAGQKAERTPVALDERRPRRRRKAVWLAAATGAAAAVLAVVLLAGLPGSHQGPAVFGPQPSTAAEAIRYALGALDGAQGLRGTLYIGKVRDGAFSAGDKVTFLCARDGSYRITTTTLGKDALFPLPGYVETTAYDAHTRVMQGSYDYGKQGFRYQATTEDPVTGAPVTTTTISRYVFTESHDVAPGPPDADPFGMESVPIWQVRAYLRTMLGDPGVEFTTGDLDGRPVWLLRTEAFAAGSRRGSRGRPVTIAIDAGTRLPLRVSGFRGRYELRIESAALTEALAASEFTLEKPPAAETQDQSRQSDLRFLEQFTRFPALPFSAAAGMNQAVDGIPAFPAWVPRDFTLQIGASRTNGAVDLPRAQGAPRRSIPGTIVSLAFRHGFDTVYVSLRPDPRLSGASMIGLPGETEPTIRVDTSDPFVGDVAPWDRAQLRRHTTDVQLRSGSFGGATAHIIVDPGYWPHLWVQKDGWVATVAGDLTKARMTRIAESLGPWNGLARQ